MSIRRIAVAGAAGRMGRRLIALAAEDPAFECVAALERPDSPELGRDAGELAGVPALSLPLAAATEQPFDVLVEFSRPDGTMHWLGVCEARRSTMITGTTGHDDGQLARIRSASGRIPILHAPNMSVGVNVMLRAAEMLAQALDAACDIEITEAHHRFKIDAPSGTALALRDAVLAGRAANTAPAGRAENTPAHPGGPAGSPSIIYGRHGRTGPRPPGQIALHSLRLGDTVGEHTVAFGTLGETLTLAHAAHSRDTFAAGALRAARWIVGRPPGLYTMRDVLFPEEPRR